MSYTRNTPTCEALQWTGSNVQEMIDFANAWQGCFPGGTAEHDPQTDQILTCTGWALEVGDWITSAGRWPNSGGRNGGGYDFSSEVLNDIAFQSKYSMVT